MIDRSAILTRRKEPEDPWAFAPVGSKVRSGGRRGTVIGRWLWIAVVEFEDGSTERRPLNGLVESDQPRA